ncbi:GNAT family N-acetyltransferase [Mycetohabitans endofungorum]|uniref:GNAT family N-acetyltransferase n=1 Tax=Mycetohabitans endofungorum TaxID=417203 RepID=UPI0030D06F72
MKPSFPPWVAAPVRLRLLAERDLSATLEWRNRDGVRQQFKSSETLAWEQHLSWFHSYCDKADDLMFIVEDAATGARIGQVAIYAIDLKRGNAEVGRFVVAPDFQGKGLMRRAISALLCFAHRELHLNSVHLEVRQTNDRARGLYEVLGFRPIQAADGMIKMERDLDGDV